MAELKIWTCDRCKKEWNSKEHQNPLRLVRVCVSNLDQPHRQEWSQEWCRDCQQELGLNRETPKPNAPPLSEPLGLEEMIRLIVREEIEGEAETCEGVGTDK